MKPTITFGGIIAFVVIAILAYLFFTKRGELKRVLTESLNPASQENIVNKAVNKAIFPDGQDSIGTKIFDWVDGIKDALPFLESEKEKIERMRLERASANSSQEPVSNPSILTIRVNKNTGDFASDNP